MPALLRLQRRWPIAQALVLVALFAYGAATIEGFSSPATLDTMLVLAALLGIASFGQTAVVLLGGMDLSIPGFVLAGALVSGKLTASGWPFGLTLLVIVVAAGALGAITGWTCHRLRLQPLILTLAMSAIVAGGVIVWTGARATGQPPAWVSELTSPVGTTFGLGIPPIVALWALLAGVVAVVLARTVSGRRLYATGENPRAAALARIPTARIWASVFALSAVSSAMVGVLLAGFVGTGDLTLGDPYLFQSLTAVIIGGTTLGGARGDYTHTVIGTLLLVELTTILVGHGLSSADQQILFGALILVAVAAYGRDVGVRDRA